MPATKTVHIQTKARCTGEMRDELLSTVGCCYSAMLSHYYRCDLLYCRYWSYCIDYDLFNYNSMAEKFD